MNVYGLKEFANKVPELLRKKTRNKKNPEKWSWVPAKPDKIKNILKYRTRETKAVNYACMSNYRPTDKKQNIVLLFAMGNLSYSLVSHLEENKLSYFFLDYPQFVVKGSVTVSTNDGRMSKILQMEDLRLNLDDVKVVLWNPPKYPYPFTDSDMIPRTSRRNKFLHRKRWAQFLRELSGLLPEDVTWVPGNPFNGSQEWQNKISEYLIAHECGLQVPPFIFTNKRKELSKFSEQQGTRLLLREFASPPYSFPPVNINTQHVPEELLKTSPCFFQKYIEKEYEFRVVVLFDKIFPCKIYSQDSELAREDWRVYDDARVKWELTTLPEEVCAKIIQIREKLGLLWCSIDLIYSKDGNYYYLETNRPGAHYWLELFVGLDIGKEIALVLKEKKLSDTLT